MKGLHCLLFQLHVLDTFHQLYGRFTGKLLKSKNLVHVLHVYSACSTFKQNYLSYCTCCLNGQMLVPENHNPPESVTLSIYRKHLSHVMRKPAFCICENKDADQL